MPGGPTDPDVFIARWRHADGSELANAQSFTRELCELLEVPIPDPARADTLENAYVFERRVLFRHGDGSSSEGRIDCYRRGAFVLEAKKLRQAGKGFDDGMLRARAQAENYARNLPAEEGRPPFLIVVDVGNVIELYAEFSRSGATYTPFPDPRSHRIRLADLGREPIRARLRQLWLDPLGLDPGRVSARVTREISGRLAEVARDLEGAGHDPEGVAGFLSRCLFCMFAEDVGLLPRVEGRGAFTDLLESFVQPGLAAPAQFVPLLAALWREMDSGGFSVVLRRNLPRFNGKLFKQPHVLPLDRAQIGHLLQAAKSDWTQVEPAIFGTLLERALDPLARHALGAHYTPRAYVERLVLPTVIEPLRGAWNDSKAAALVLAAEGKADAARTELRGFHHQLCQVRVLDPACGSGNFLYVTLEHMKRLEGEVLDLLDQLGDTQGRLEAEGLTVDPHQFLGLELNPRAAAIAELVLWIGYLQWHFRTRGNALPPSPILKDFHNIECRDAVLAHDGMDYALDAAGLPVSRWDGRTTKPHPVTGEPVPDEAARIPLERYRQPRRAEWPEADYVVGNPPFIGAASMRAVLGDGYVEALRGAWGVPPSPPGRGAGGEGGVPESADFVMYWWQQAADLVRAGRLRRFGFITTNSIRQTFNRRVIEAALGRHSRAGGNPGGSSNQGLNRNQIDELDSRLRGNDGALTLRYAIPDHPWVDSADGAAVRIAMTVAAARPGEGRLLTVSSESASGGEGLDVRLTEKIGAIHADLSIGADVAGTGPLKANAGIANRGVQMLATGFVVTPEQAEALLPSPGGGAGGFSPADHPCHSPHLAPLPEGEGEKPLIRPYRNGRDLTDKPRGVLVIDAFGLTEAELRQRHPAIWQWLYDRAKPERDHNSRDSYREYWWLFGENQPAMRHSIEGLRRYIATAVTAKHRVFQFLDAEILPDQALVCIASDDAYLLGVLSSQLHVVWALAAGGTLEDRPRYNKTRCFDTFPFPDSLTPGPSPEGRGESLVARIRVLAEELDAHRKRCQALHPELTLTGMYNVLEALRAGRVLTAKEKAIHEQSLVALLKQLHDDLDATVLAAYGWSDLIGVRDDAELLHRLAALNGQRAREEAGGRVRWLRPEFQNPNPSVGGPLAGRTSAEHVEQIRPASGPPTPAAGKRPWPAALPEQVAAVAEILRGAAAPLSEADIAARFTGKSGGKGAWKKRLPQLLETLVALGRARRVDEGVWWE